MEEKERYIYEILIEELEKQLPKDGNTYNVHIISALKELKTEFDWFLINLFHPSTGINGVKNYCKIIDGFDQYLKLKKKVIHAYENIILDEEGFNIKN